jgi:hypothetical protein
MGVKIGKISRSADGETTAGFDRVGRPGASADEKAVGFCFRDAFLPDTGGLLLGDVLVAFRAAYDLIEPGIVAWDPKSFVVLPQRRRPDVAPNGRAVRR